MVRACVLFAAGTNCDSETAHAFELAGAQAETVHINRLKDGKQTLAPYDILVLPGGFSYGDYVSSGRILANELVHHLKEQLLEFHDKGKLILGICNGFQVLTKSGLLPATDSLFEKQTVTLDWNDSGRYEDRWAWLKVEDTPCVFTKDMDDMVYFPVAHAEGKFIPKSKALLERLDKNRQVVFRYTTESGEPPTYPDNPNGSVDGVTGICDPSGRILGMMPHPERFVRTEQHPHWHRDRRVVATGIRLFENAVAYAQ